MKEHLITISNHGFYRIFNGLKSIELRINTERFGAIEENDILKFIDKDSRIILKKVFKIKKYNSFRECLIDNEKDLKKINNMSESIEDSLDIYLKPKGIYTKTKEMNGVLAFYLE